MTQNQTVVDVTESALRDAWKENNAEKFQSSLTEDVKVEVIEDILTMIIEDRDKVFLGLNFAKILFENHKHRKIFQKGESLIWRLVKHGNWQILKLLLEYHPNLRQTTVTGKTPLHYLCKASWADNFESMKKCMELLLHHDEVDINALNNKEQTPIDCAIDAKNSNAVEMLLKSGKNLYLDGEVSGGKTSRVKLFEMYPQFSELVKAVRIVNGNQVTVSKLLFVLNQGEERRFEKLFPAAFHDETLINSSSNKKHLLLQVACKKKMRDIVRILLDYGADPSYIDEWNDYRSAITIAVEEPSNNFEMLALLLKSASVLKFKSENIRMKLPHINNQDGSRNTVLHYATDDGNEAAILQILEFGGYMGAKNANNEIPLPKIPPKVLKHFLDSNIQPSKENTHCGKSSKITFDYNFLKRQIPIGIKNLQTPPEMKILKGISQIKNLRPLITHPVLSSFIHLKWDKLKPLFYLNLIFYTLLTILMSFNILYMSVTGQQMLTATRYIQSFFILLLLLREILQVFVHKQRYIYQLENYIEVALIGGGGFLSFDDCSNPITCRHVGAFMLVLSWFGFLLLIGKHPRFSIQVEMLMLVLLSFLNFLYVYLIMILAFAFAFFVLFNECVDHCSVNEFAGVGASVFKTLIMVSGEFDASDSPFDIYPVTSHILFLLFVFLVAIVLLNLLNGLAVHDTKKIKEDAELLSFVSRIKYLASLEKLLYKLCLRFYLEKDDGGAIWRWVTGFLRFIFNEYYWNFRGTYCSEQIGGVVSDEIINKAHDILKQKAAKEKGKEKEFILNQFYDVERKKDLVMRSFQGEHDFKVLLNTIEKNIAELKTAWLKISKKVSFTGKKHLPLVDETEEVEVKSRRVSGEYITELKFDFAKQHVLNDPLESVEHF